MGKFSRSKFILTIFGFTTLFLAQIYFLQSFDRNYFQTDQLTETPDFIISPPSRLSFTGILNPEFDMAYLLRLSSHLPDLHLSPRLIYPSFINNNSNNQIAIFIIAYDSSNPSDFGSFYFPHTTPSIHSLLPYQCIISQSLADLLGLSPNFQINLNPHTIQ